MAIIKTSIEMPPSDNNGSAIDVLVSLANPVANRPSLESTSLGLPTVDGSDKGSSSHGGGSSSGDNSSSTRVSDYSAQVAQDLNAINRDISVDFLQLPHDRTPLSKEVAFQILTQSELGDYFTGETPCHYIPLPFDFLFLLYTCCLLLHRGGSPQRAVSLLCKSNRPPHSILLRDVRQTPGV
jgi:hypothetical protein